MSLSPGDSVRILPGPERGPGWRPYVGQVGMLLRAEERPYGFMVRLQGMKDTVQYHPGEVERVTKGTDP